MPVNVEEMIREAVKELRSDAVEKNTKFTVDVDSSCYMSANPLLTTVFSNLLSNAVKYGPEGGEVRVTSEAVNGMCRIAVADRGEGIADEDKEEIFTRFSRIDKRGVKGSGLGLAIVKHVVALHGGRCWVEDNPGGGSIFHVELKTV